MQKLKEHTTPNATFTLAAGLFSALAPGISGETRGIIIAGLVAAYHVGGGIRRRGVLRELQLVAKKLSEGN